VGDKFGWSVSLSTPNEIRVAVGAKMDNGVNGSNSGHVRVFGWSGNNWTQIGEDMDGASQDDEYGYSVSMTPDGQTVASGAAHHNESAGMVRVLTWDRHRWEQVGRDIIGTDGDNFGLSVSLSGFSNTLAFGAPQLTQNGCPLRHLRIADNVTGGYVQVFKRKSDSWRQIGQDLIGQSKLEMCGWDVSLSEDGSVVVFRLELAR